MAAAITSALLASSACSTRGLMFVQDHRIAIDAPRDNATVHLPFTVDFSIHARPAGVVRYGVFLDRNPPRSGQAIPKDTDRTGIYLTAGRTVPIRYLVQSTIGPSSERNRHTITVVFLDAHGHRVGESADVVQFRVRT